MSTPLQPSKAVPRKGRFETCLAHLLKAEGGYNNFKADKGGATNHGISLRFAVAEARIDPVVRQLLDIDLDGDIDVADIRALTPEDVAPVYRRCFWDRYRCGSLLPRLDGALFDQAVNGGGMAAVKLLQQATNLAFGFPQIVVDGRIGPRTIAAANEAGPDRVLDQMRHAAATRYSAIVRADPTQRKFLAGWLNRASTLGKA